MERKVAGSDGGPLELRGLKSLDMSLEQAETVKTSKQRRSVRSCFCSFGAVKGEFGLN